MSGMKVVAWLTEVPLPGQRNPSQSHFSCVIAVSLGPASSSTASEREEGGEIEREKRSTEIRAAAPGMDSLSGSEVSRAVFSGELRIVQSVGKPTLPSSMRIIVLSAASGY